METISRDLGQGVCWGRGQAVLPLGLTLLHLLDCSRGDKWLQSGTAGGGAGEVEAEAIGGGKAGEERRGLDQDLHRESPLVTSWQQRKQEATFDPHRQKTWGQQAAK